MKKYYVNKKIFALFLMVCILILICVAGKQEEAEATEKIVLKYAHMAALKSHHDKVADQFKELLTKETEDKVEIQIYPAGQLGDEKEILDGIQLGTIEIATVSTAILSNLVPEVGVITFPYLFRDFEHVNKFFEGEVAEELSDIVLKRVNIRILAWHPMAFRDMITKKPIYSIQDFKGVKFRSPNIPVYIEMFRAIGANPTPIPYTEVYQAMKTGIVDGMETSPHAMLSSKIYEVTKYVIRTGHIFGANVVLMSNKVYVSLPDDVKKAIDRSAKKLQPWIADFMLTLNKKAYDELKDKGLKMINIDKKPLQEACKIVWEELSKGTPALIELPERIINIQ